MIKSVLTWFFFIVFAISRDCDEYTMKFYSENTGVPIDSIKAIPIENDAHHPQEQEIPPYNGFGTVEDSLGSCKYLVLKPPKKDFIKMLENEHKVLRFVARMVNNTL